ncbi:MAG TPA: CusA/CzcA family heavy metal efflux RND transporter [Rhodothermales bacterium]|nr:CusA/CzcA family heavy metal efflux RND transporter [Rhodothermales bacterium]
MMLKFIIEWSAVNRQIVLLLTALITVAAVWVTLNTPVDAIPDLSDVQVIVKTDFPGQGPNIVEEQVTYPLSTAMLAVPHAKTVRGYSMFGTSFVYVIFEDGTDLYWARSRVLEYLNFVSTQLPPDVRPALGPDATGVGWVFAYSVVDTTGQYDLAELRAFQDFFIRYELQSLEGVSEVATIGGFQRQYQVIVDPQRLSAYGIPISVVRESIRNSNQDVGGRLLELGEREFIVRGKGYLKGVDDIRSVPLKAPGTGTTVTVGDVARVQLGPDIRRGIADKNGEGEVVGGIVVMRSGGNAKAVIETVKARIEEVQRGLPSGVQIITEYDRSILINESIATLVTKLWQEMLVVALVVLVFLLHFRSAFVALISIPVGILMALLVMNMLDINANIMSLGGIAIAIGVMVDASIVLVENAHRHLERTRERLGRPLQTEERHRAVLDAAIEVGPSLFFSLLIVTISFLPVFALQQAEGRLFRPLALTKTFAMAAASLLAVTLVPALLMAFVGEARVSSSRSVMERAIRALYGPAIRMATARPVLTVVLSVAVLATSILPLQRLLFDRVYVAVPQLGSEFMPPLDEGDLMYMPTTLPGVSAQKAKEILQQTDRIIASFPEVASVFGKVGRAETATDPAPMSMIETTVILKPKEDWREGMTREKLVRELDRAIQIPGLTNAWTMPIKARTDMLSTGIKTPVGIKVAGPDLRTLEQIGTQIEQVIRPLAGTQSVYAERVMGGSFLDIEINRREAARYGLTTGEVQDVISSAIGGKTVTTTVEGLERYPVNVRYPRALRDNLPALRNVLVPISATSSVPLGQIAEFKLVEGPPMIRSENARPNAWVFVDIDPMTDVGTYTSEAQKAVAASISLPAGYSLTWSGQFEYIQRANKRLAFLVPLTLAIIFLLLMLHFRSLPEVLLVFAILPFPAIGGVWLLAFLGYDASIAVGVGFIAVAGLAAETGVVMLVYLSQAVAADRAGATEYVDPAASIERGALLRIRPVVMTIATTFLGLLPIMIGTETGSDVMKRIAAPMVGGVATAMIASTLVLPALYLLLERRRARNVIPAKAGIQEPNSIDHQEPTMQ